MSGTVEVTPARRQSRARFLVLIPLLPALAALAFVAIVPLSAVSSDEAAQSLPATIVQPAAALAQATPAITASPSPSAAAAEIFSAPPITILPPPPPPPPKAKKSSASVSSAPYSAYEQENLAYLNQARADVGLSGLAWSSRLANTARYWATYLAESGSEVRHSTLWTNGENIYWISGGSGESLALRAHNAFMNSTGHRDNVLRESFTSVGIGIAHSDGGWYLVQNFAN
jgi:uncharacterized protein YkwD